MKQPSIDPRTIERERETEEWEKQRLDCMRQCVADLPPDRKLLITVYARANTDQRQQIADQLGVPLHTLRLRISQIRKKLEQCKTRCLKKIV